MMFNELYILKVSACISQCGGLLVSHSKIYSGHFEVNERKKHVVSCYSLSMFTTSTQNRFFLTACECILLSIHCYYLAIVIKLIINRIRPCACGNLAIIKIELAC